MQHKLCRYVIKKMIMESERVTISSFCRQTQISRSTFYHLYETVGQLMLMIFKQDLYLQFKVNEKRHTFAKNMYEYLQMIKKDILLYEVMFDQIVDDELSSEMVAHFTNLLKFHLKSDVYIREDVLNTFALNLWLLILFWVRNHCQEDVDSFYKRIVYTLNLRKFVIHKK